MSDPSQLYSDIDRDWQTCGIGCLAGIKASGKEEDQTDNGA